MNKILITGGNGFIAKSLYEYLSNVYFEPLKSNVICLNRQGLDLLDTKKVADYLKKEKFDVVIHTANHDAVPSFTDKMRSDVLDINLRMFSNLSSCREHYGKMLYFGSGAEAGRENWVPKMTEEYIEEFVPKDPYGYSKHIMNKKAKDSSNIYNLRLFGLYGKFDDWRYRFIPNACCKAVLGMPITLKKDALFDYLYISDLARIVHWFIENTPKYHSYNICSAEVSSYKELGQKVIKFSRKDLDLETLEEGEGIEYSGDNFRLLQEKHFTFVPTGVAIADLYKWYDRHHSIIVKEDFLY